MKKCVCIFTLLLGILALSQTILAQPKCSEPVRKTVWQTLDKEILSGPWDCREVLETQDISSSRLDAILVRGYGPPFCGATGNCSTWLLSRVNGKWRIILNAGSVIEYFEIKTRRNSGYPDLLFRSRMGIRDHYSGTYRFNGKRYSLLSCKYEVYDAHGKLSVTRAPSGYCSN